MTDSNEMPNNRPENNGDDARDTRNNGDFGEMNPRFENIAAYVLDALDDESERAAVETLIETDAEAHAEYLELVEAVGHLAVGVPSATPPVHLKATILALASEDAVPVQEQPLPAAAPASISWWASAFRSGYASSAIAAVLILIVAASLGYQNNQLGNEIDVLRADLSVESASVAGLRAELATTLTDSETRVATMKSEMAVMEDEFGATTEMVVHQEEMVSELATVNDALKQALRDQSWLTYVAMKEDYHFESWLASTQQVTAEPVASGLIAVRIVGNEAVFQVLGLPQPNPGYAYTLWLMGNGDPQPVSQFEVSEIGSATVAFLLPAPLQFYSSVMVTQERVNGVGSDPSGTSVLSAETN
jgi:anti-sigma-K factor RskA